MLFLIVLIPTSTRHYYFYFSSQPISSLSFSSSFSSLLNLSYCEHQQTTYYSSSGFSILHSSSRFSTSKIQENQNSIPSHTHNAVLSTTDHSPSTTGNPIELIASSTTLSSSSSLSNKHDVIIDHDDVLISTTINSFTTSTLSNNSLLHSTLSIKQRETRTMNRILLIGCIISIIPIMIIIYTIFKHCCSRDKGSYRIDESKNFPTKLRMDIEDNNGCTGKILSPNHHRQNLAPANEENIVDSKEWYV